MKREILFLLLVLAIQLVSAIRINEIEANPQGSPDSGNEWVELYSENEINVSGWRLWRADNKGPNLTGTFLGYLIINFTTAVIRDNNENISLINENGSIVDYFYSINDTFNDNRTWSKCDGEWLFINGSRGAENNCPPILNNPGNSTNQTQNQTNQTQSNSTSNQSSNQSTNQTTATSLRLSFPEHIYSDDEFDVKINLTNLESAFYDIKVFIINNNGKIISEAYDEKNSIWVNSFYYIEEFTRGLGNKFENISLRLGEKYKDSEGNFTLYARLRKSGSSDYVESSGKIYVEARENYNNTGYINNTGLSNNTNASVDESSAKLTADVIYLNYRENNGDNNSKDIKSSIIYRSKSQKIKDYSIYGFAALCILIISFLLYKQKAR